MIPTVLVGATFTLVNGLILFFITRLVKKMDDRHEAIANTISDISKESVQNKTRREMLTKRVNENKASNEANTERLNRHEVAIELIALKSGVNVKL